MRVGSPSTMWVLGSGEPNSGSGGSWQAPFLAKSSGPLHGHYFNSQSSVPFVLSLIGNSF